MSLMAIILWALYPLSRWKRFYELTRHVLQTFLDALADPQALDWLHAHAENPEGIARIEACALRFDDIERLAERRAQKLARVFARNPSVFLHRAMEAPRSLTEQQLNSGGGPAYLLAPLFEATVLSVPHQIGRAATSAPVSLARSGEDAGGRSAVFIFVSHQRPARRAGLRVRAPP